MSYLSPNSVSALLINWYQKYRRNLPWRETKDPYKIWLSEIILQQTRVDQGMPYYRRYITDYPTVRDLAAATEEEVLKRWQGLGYYSRARNLHAAAKMVVEKFNGVFPPTFEELKYLKGVGDYTASAIASIAFNLPYAVVDGNVFRVLSRIYNIQTPLDSPAGKREFASMAFEILDHKNPGIHNQAVMELGALICKPKSPLCNECPVMSICLAYRNNLINILPVKSKKTKVRIRYFNYFLVKHKDSIYLNKRPAGDIWQNLYDFPLIETSTPVDPLILIESSEWKDFFGKSKILIESAGEILIHKLSHQHIHTRFFVLKFVAKPPAQFSEKYIKVEKEKLQTYAVPKPVELILEEKMGVYNIVDISS